jgi:hypothetical protein
VAAEQSHLNRKRRKALAIVNLESDTSLDSEKVSVKSFGVEELCIGLLFGFLIGIQLGIELGIWKY